MNTIDFFNKQRRLIMQFYDIEIVTTEGLKIVTFTGEVNFDFFHVKTVFEAEEFELKNFLFLLKKMYRGEQLFITFNPLLGKIILKFSVVEYLIEVRCEIYNNLSECRFEFVYEIDQSFLPDLIKDIEMVLSV